MCVFVRLLHTFDVGFENGSGGSWWAGEDEDSCRVETPSGSRSHVDTAGVTLVHLSLHWRSACGGTTRHTQPDTCRWVKTLTQACLFVLQTVLRIWDCLFYEGSKILFRVALTLIRPHQAEILPAQNLPDICERFKHITKAPDVHNCHTFMQVAHTTNTFLIDKKLFVNMWTSFICFSDFLQENLPGAWESLHGNRFQAQRKLSSSDYSRRVLTLFFLLSDHSRLLVCTWFLTEAHIFRHL